MRQGAWLTTSGRNQYCPPHPPFSHSLNHIPVNSDESVYGIIDPLGCFFQIFSSWAASYIICSFGNFRAIRVMILFSSGLRGFKRPLLLIYILIFQFPHNGTGKVVLDFGMAGDRLTKTGSGILLPIQWAKPLISNPQYFRNVFYWPWQE